MTQVTRRSGPGAHWPLVLIAFAAAPAWAAEAVKLRPISPVYSDAKGGGLRKPEGVACGANGSLIVADTGNGRLLRYTVSGETVTAAGEIVLPQIPTPIRVQIAASGDILALDGKLRKIARLSPSGEFKSYVDLSAGGLSGTVIPRSFKLGATDTLYVLDVFGGRVIVLGADGKLVRQIAFPQPHGFVSDLAVGAKDTVFLLDSVEKRLYVAARDATAAIPLTGSMREDMDFPAAIAADDRGRLLVADQNGGGIVILGQDGSFRGRQSAFGWKEGFLRYPGELCLDANGTLFVADRENNRIQVFLTGR